MNDDISSTSSVPHGVMAVPHKGGRAVIAMAWVFVISGAFLKETVYHQRRRNGGA